MSTRILEDDEVAREGDIYAYVNTGHGHGKSAVLVADAGFAGNIPGWILREVNASCRCLSEDEPMRAGDVIVLENEEEFIVSVQTFTTPGELRGWAGKTPLAKWPATDIVAVVRYE